MKRTVLVLLMVASAVALFANGSSPNAGDMTGPEWSRSRDGFDGEPTPPVDALFTPIELTGAVSIIDGRAVLTADGETYLLAIPRIAWYADGVVDGSVITVTGNLVEGVEHDEVVIDADGYIAVDQVEIDGELIAIGTGGPGGRADDAPRGGFTNDPYGRQTDDDDRPYRRAEDDNRRAPGRGEMPRGRRI